MIYLIIMTLLNKLFNLVLILSSKHNIDESHGIMHSMNILHYTNILYESELYVNPYIKNQEKMIYVTAILHDMCDKKYMNETEGVNVICNYLEYKQLLNKEEIEISKKIITTMSYSKVKKDGFPNLGHFQKAYNIVREADLLTGYDFDRAIIYHMKNNGENYVEAFNSASTFFNNRVFKHNEDNLFFLEYSKLESQRLHQIALQKINFHKKILNKLK